MIRPLPLILALSCALSLSACSTFSRVHEANDTVNKRADDATSIVKQQTTARPATEAAVTFVSDGLWVDTTAVKRDAIVPAVLRCPIAYATRNPVELTHIASRITATCHIPVRLTADALQHLDGTLGDGTGGTKSASPVVPAPTGAPPLADSPMPSGSGMGYASTGRGDNRVSVTYDGALSGLLDAVTGQLGLSWKLDQARNVIVVSYLQTQAFTVAAIPSTTGIATSVTTGANSSAGASGGMGGGSSGGSSSGGISGQSQSQSETQVAVSSDVLKDLTAAINSMLTPGVGRMAVSASTGIVTITDTPDVVARVGAYIEQENAVLNRQVQLNVKVLAVDLTHSDSMGINWNAIYTSLKQHYSINVASAWSTPTGSTTGGVSILDGSTTRWSGSQAMIDALNTQGNVSTIYESPLTTLNLQPVPIQVSDQRGYIARREISQTAQVGSLQSTEPGNVTTGFSMAVLPYILPNNKTVLLQFALNLSTLNKIEQQGSAESYIQTPDISSSIFSQKVRVTSGQTLVMAGYLASQDTVNKQGTGSVDNFVLGGGAKADKHRKVIVILVTPVVLR